MTANARERAAATAAKGVKRRDLSADMIQSAEKQPSKYANLTWPLRIFNAVCARSLAARGNLQQLVLKN